MNCMWVCCDYVGTYDKLSRKEKEDMLRNFDAIRRKEKLEQVLFSFASTNPCTELGEIAFGELQEIAQLLNERGAHIGIGPQLGGDGYVTRKDGEVNTDIIAISKGMSMIQMFQKLEELNYHVQDFVYMDDSPNINSFILLKGLEKEKYNPSLTFIEPGESNLKYKSSVGERQKVNFLSNLGEDFVIEGSSKLKKIVDKDKEERGDE